MSIRIFTDSGADMEAWELQTYRVGLIPLTITIDGRIYSANENFNKQDFFTMLDAAKIFPSTSQPAPAAFEEAFEEAKAAGDSLILITLSAALSGTNQSANVIKGLGEYENVYVVDSRNVSIGQKLLVLEAVSLRSQGKSAPEIAAALEALRGKIHIYAGLSTLEYLRKGGRLGRAAAGLGTLAQIKPVVSVDKNGSVQVAAKCMGKARAMKEIAALVAAAPPDPAHPILGIYSGDEAPYLELKERLETAGLQIPETFCLGPVIGAHIGPGAYGVAYVEK